MTQSRGAWRAVGAFIAVAIIVLALFDPIPQPAQSILQLTLTAILVAFGVRAWFASGDDVVKEAVRVATRWGLPLGFAAAIVGVMAVRYAPALSDALARLAAVNANAPASTVAFGVGVAFALACVLLASAAVYVGWWMRKR